MRYHAGRKVGKRGYVGVSASSKEVNGCFSMLITWPFKLLYYIFVFPFKWLIVKFKGSKTKVQKGIYGGLVAVLAIFFGTALLAPDKEPEQPEEPVKSVFEEVEETPMPTVEPTIEPTPEPTSTPEPTPAPIYKYINADELNLREEPSRDCDILGEYHLGDRVEIIGEKDEWYQVNINGTVGYMVKEYITDERPYIVYWAPTGEKYHSRDDCSTLNNTVFSGTLEDAIDAGREEPCGVCIG